MDNLHDVDVEEETENVKIVDSDYEQSEDEILVDKNKSSRDGNGAGTSEPVGTKARTSREPVVESDLEWSTDELNSVCESDMEIGDAVNEKKKKKKSRFTEFNPDTDFADPEFRLGMVFPTIEHFRKAVKEYAIMSKRNVQFVRNEKHRVRVKCTGSYPWMMFASNICNSISVTIKTINSEHTCGRDFEKIKYVNSAWLAEKYVSKFKADPK